MQMVIPIVKHIRHTVASVGFLWKVNDKSSPYNHPLLQVKNEEIG